MPDVHHTVENRVATITISNVEKYNAMTLSMWSKLSETLVRLREAGDIRALILRGEGIGAFVSGADITEFELLRNNESGAQAYENAVDRAQSALEAFPCPVIAAISGFCYGGGLGLALSCDVRFSSHTAKFRMPAAKLGLGYTYKGLKRMVSVLGRAKAGELFYTARVCNADEALAIGLVNHKIPDVFGYADSIAAEIAANAPLTVSAGKLALNTLLWNDDVQGMTAVAEAVLGCFTSADYVEGRKAFSEKRVPKFVGR